MEAGLTLDQAAEMVGVDLNTIWRYEADKFKPSGPAFAMLCQAYGNPAVWFQEDSGSPGFINSSGGTGVRELPTGLNQLVNGDKQNEVLATRLRAARGGLSRLVVFKATGISVAAIQRYEEGQREPMSGHLRRLARFYGRTTEWLWGDESEVSQLPEQRTEPRPGATLEIYPGLSEEYQRLVDEVCERLLWIEVHQDESRRADEAPGETRAGSN